MQGLLLDRFREGVDMADILSVLYHDDTPRSLSDLNTRRKPRGEVFRCKWETNGLIEEASTHGGSIPFRKLSEPIDNVLCSEAYMRGVNNASQTMTAQQIGLAHTSGRNQGNYISREPISITGDNRLSCLLAINEIMRTKAVERIMRA